MITGIPLKQHRPDWQQEMAQAISDPEELLAILDIDPALVDAELSSSAFRLKVPISFIRRMQKGNPADPLLRQILPIHAEHDTIPGFINDPVGDLDAMSTPGLIHKYAGRALLIVTGACAVHCRYCFRRHFPYGEANLSAEHLQLALRYLQNNKDIHEIILSGGDPLSLPDKRLAALLEEIEGIPHIQRLRIHTRLPVVIPSRITPDFIKLISGTRLQTSIVVHINHAQEIDQGLGEALERLRKIGVTLLNQTVLLGGVNDSAQVLTRLSENLYEHGVLPYYLHLLDPVQGSAHFEIEQYRAEEIYKDMRRSLPGYLVPRLVRETAGKPYKIPIGSI
jgi:EF-P beta-lysylation protein EpmB